MVSLKEVSSMVFLAAAVFAGSTIVNAERTAKEARAINQFGQWSPVAVSTPATATRVTPAPNRHARRQPGRPVLNRGRETDIL